MLVVIQYSEHKNNTYILFMLMRRPTSAHYSELIGIFSKS